MEPSPNGVSRKFLLTFAVLLVLFGIALLLNSHHNKVAVVTDPNAGKITSTRDAASGQTVTTIQGENQTKGNPNPADDPSQSGSGPYYLGINELLNRGLTTDQIYNMENGFSYYFGSAKLNPKQVSIAVNTIKLGQLNSGTENQIDTIDFDTVFDSTTTVYAQVQYSGLSSTRLLLFNKSSGAQIYDSGTINTMR